MKAQYDCFYFNWAIFLEEWSHSGIWVYAQDLNAVVSHQGSAEWYKRCNKWGISASIAYIQPTVLLFQMTKGMREQELSIPIPLYRVCSHIMRTVPRCHSKSNSRTTAVLAPYLECWRRWPRRLSEYVSFELLFAGQRGETLTGTYAINSVTMQWTVTCQHGSASSNQSESHFRLPRNDLYSALETL